jgi:hypothetical protein
MYTSEMQIKTSDDSESDDSESDDSESGARFVYSAPPPALESEMCILCWGSAPNEIRREVPPKKLLITQGQI